MYHLHIQRRSINGRAAICDVTMNVFHCIISGTNHVLEDTRGSIRETDSAYWRGPAALSPYLARPADQ